ncbi:MAG: hypothetical protein RBR97_12230 [Bacteroidales bacterium]|nr:hypothetical protein [Bacteroidales bacterium]
MAKATALEKINRIINYTNRRLAGWYQNAEKDFGVAGSGTCYWDGENIVIIFTEDDTTQIYSIPYYDNEPMDYYFNVWMEL